MIELTSTESYDIKVRGVVWIIDVSKIPTGEQLNAGDLFKLNGELVRLTGTEMRNSRQLNSNLTGITVSKVEQV